MDPGDALGQVEFAVLDAMHRGALRSRRTPCQIRVLRGWPAGQAILHDVLRRCEREMATAQQQGLPESEGWARGMGLVRQIAANKYKIAVGIAGYMGTHVTYSRVRFHVYQFYLRVIMP